MVGAEPRGSVDVKGPESRTWEPDLPFLLFSLAGMIPFPHLNIRRELESLKCPWSCGNTHSYNSKVWQQKKRQEPPCFQRRTSPLWHEVSDTQGLLPSLLLHFLLEIREVSSFLHIYKLSGKVGHLASFSEILQPSDLRS